MCLNLGNGGPFGGRLPECHANPRATWSPHPDAVSAAVAGWSPRSKSRSVALWLWLNAMVYGRYNELVFMWFINQHSHHWGAPSCSDLILNITWVAKKITIQALYKKSLHVKENEGLDFLAAYMFCGKKKIYIYANGSDVKKLRDPGILKAKKFRCMWRSPFAPLLNFLNHERVYKDSIWSGKWSQPPLQP